VNNKLKSYHILKCCYITEKKENAMRLVDVGTVAKRCDAAKKRESFRAGSFSGKRGH